MSGLKDSFQKVVDCIFKTFKSFVVTGDIVLPPRGYNAAAGTVGKVYSSGNISAISSSQYELPGGHGQTYVVNQTIIVAGFSESANNGVKTITAFSGNLITVAETLVIESLGLLITITNGETVYPVEEIIFVDYELSRIDGQIIRRLDKNALFRASEIDVEITEQMIMRFSDGDEWDIVNIIIDPANAMYDIQCRRP